MQKKKKKKSTMKKRQMTALTNNENESYFKQKCCYIWKKKFSTNGDKGIAFNEKYHKLPDHCHYIGKYRGTDFKIGYQKRI